MQFQERPKPSNATYFDSGVVESGTDHALKKVEVTFYPDDRLKLTVPKGCPVVIRQAYLEGAGNDAIIELAPRT